MSRSLNKAILIGNISSDLKIKSTPIGKNVATFNLATNEKYIDKNGQTIDKAEFHSIVLWDKLADVAKKILKKGSKVYIEGKLQTRSWEAQDGIKRYKTEIIGSQIISINKGGEITHIDENGKTKSVSKEDAMVKGLGNENNSSGELNSQSTITKKSVSKKEEEISIEDIPF